MKFSDISNNISELFNYAFNNNGIEVDKTRIRLCDGSPIHSVGTTRFRSKWPYALAVAAPIAVNYALDEDTTALDFILPVTSIAVIASLRRVDKYGFNEYGMDTEILCINKNPDKDTYSVPNKYIHEVEGIMLTSKLGTIIPSVVIPIVPYYSIPILADRVRMYYTYSKVSKGDWVIEEMPKPKEKETEHIVAPMADMS